MDELLKNNNSDNSKSEDAYLSIRSYVIDAQRQVYTAVNQAMVTEYEEIIKDPYVLEFLDLPKNEHLYESELEQALINLQNICHICRP
ncbi:MAG: DUF1016 family protein [Hungatella hathewayi]|nr:DUF1016 family protein [Hungatella hathewayi]